MRSRDRLAHLGAKASLAAALAACSLGCGSTDSTPATTEPPNYDDPNVGFDAATVKELEDRGFAKYIGQFTPATETVTGAGDTTIYQFAPDPHGPICMQGTPFAASIRTGSSDDLLIYLQGGGACWTGLCAATLATSGAPMKFGWTDGDVDRNPLGPMNLLFVGYCDGSVFVGDGETPDKANGGPDGIRYQHGLANLTAALDVAHGKFPHPKRIVLSGSSAGGYGTIAGAAVVRLLWPHTHLYVINDAGIGLVNPSDPTMYDTVMKEWNLADHIPTSCADCNAQHGFAPLVGWELDHDPTIKAGAFSAFEDDVISGDFLKMAGPDFKALLLAETGAIHTAHPDRYQRFMIEGGTHTAMLAGYYDVKVNGVGLPAWTEQMIDDQAGWTDLLENGGN
jgi:hypothetical protein